MTVLSDVELSVLEKIKPKPEEYALLNEVYSLVKNAVEEHFRKISVDVEASLQGSVAHDTWLSGARDLDVFVLFPKNTPLEKLRGEYFSELAEIGRKLGTIELRYAEHPYVRLYVKGVEVDLVPAYKVDSPAEIKTAVDRTPFHTAYVNSKLTPELRDHVRLLKQFMKSIGVYGAEIKVRGFSGYVAEILVITYGGFREVLSAASEWKPPVYINSIGVDEARFKSIIKKLQKKYPDSLIYLPDPVDWERNTTANVSLESLAKFTVASICYLSKPIQAFFFKENAVASPEDLLKILVNRCVLVVKLPLPVKLPPDVLWGELWRVADRGSKTLANHDFSVIDYSAWSDEESTAYVVYELEYCVKENPKLYKGPDFWLKERVVDFIRKHVERGSIGPWISRSGVIMALGKRKYVDARQVLIERAWEYLVTPHFKNVKPEVYRAEEVVASMCKGSESGVCEWLSEFIVKRFWWMEYCTQ